MLIAFLSNQICADFGSMWSAPSLPLRPWPTSWQQVVDFHALFCFLPLMDKMVCRSTQTSQWWLSALRMGFRLPFGVRWRKVSVMASMRPHNSLHSPLHPTSSKSPDSALSKGNTTTTEAYKSVRKDAHSTDRGLFFHWNFSALQMT